MDNPVGPLTIRIGGEANGEDHEDVVDVVVLVEDAEVETVVEVEVEVGVLLDRMIPLRATAVGCVATWPATVPICSVIGKWHGWPFPRKVFSIRAKRHKR